MKAIVCLGLIAIVVLLGLIFVSLDQQRGCDGWFLSTSKKGMCQLGITQKDVDERFNNIR